MAKGKLECLAEMSYFQPNLGYSSIRAERKNGYLEAINHLCYTFDKCYTRNTYFLGEKVMSRMALYRV